MTNIELNANSPENDPSVRHMIDVLSGDTGEPTDKRLESIVVVTVPFEPVPSDSRQTPSLTAIEATPADRLNP